MAVDLEALRDSANVPSTVKTVLVDAAKAFSTLVTALDVFFAGAERRREVTLARLTVGRPCWLLGSVRRGDGGKTDRQQNHHV